MSIERQIVDAIIQEYKNKEGIFKNIDNLLEYQCPINVKYGSNEHANFYFYLIYNDHGTKSIKLYERFKNLYYNNPELFKAEYIIKNFENEEKLYESFLSNMGLRYPKESAKSWIKNSFLLFEKYKGEAINLYNSSNNALELFNNIKQFRSYGMKTTGLLLRVIKGVGFNNNLYNFENVPLPVDIHDSRIALFCNLYNEVDIENVYQTKHIKKISSIWQQIAEQLNIKWEELDKALWLLGSIGCANNMCEICPIRFYCQKGKKIEKNLFDYTSL